VVDWPQRGQRSARLLVVAVNAPERQRSLFGVTLTDDQVESLLACIEDPVQFLDALGVLKKAGWAGADDAMSGFERRLPENKTRLSALADIANGNEVYEPRPEQVLELLVDQMIAEGRFTVLSSETVPYLTSIPIERGKLRTLLDGMVEEAGRSLVPDMCQSFSSDYGGSFPNLREWLEHVAPVVFPDVRERLRWFLNHVCRVIRSVHQEWQSVIGDVVFDWWRYAGEHQADVDRMMVESLSCWRDVLDWEYAEMELEEARCRLGLPRSADDEEEVDNEGEE
jgi:hypothetical protein